MTVRLKDQVLFASGSTAIGREGRVALDRIADALQGVQGRSVRVEGYTDDVPTGPGGTYPTNWELSAARALAVVRYLQEKGVDPTLLVAAGYGQFHPVASNDTPEGRSQNRRIELVLAADVPPAAAIAPDAPAAAKPPRRPRR
jgi:chemotaxis protein MotB